jgi:YD repeat-containing protein
VDVLDGLGRVTQTWRPAPGGGYLVSEVIRALTGDEQRVSAPVQHASASLAGSFSSTRGTEFVSCTSADGLGRVRRSLRACTATQWQLYGSEEVLTSYPAPGVSESSDDEGYVKRLLQDTRGRLVRVSESDASGMRETARYGYDARSRVTRFRDGAGVGLGAPSGNVVRTRYDGAGRVREVTREAVGSGVEKAWYAMEWAGSEPSALWEGSSGSGVLVSTWEVDLLGRTTHKEVRRPDATWDEYEWEWDGEWVGARDATQDPTGTTTYGYAGGAFGATGEATTVTRTWTGGPVVSFTHAYGPESELRSTTWPDGQTTVTHEVDPATGRVQRRTVTWPGGLEMLDTLYDEWGQDAGWGSLSGATVTLDRMRPDRIEGYDFARGNGEDGRVDYRYWLDGQLREKDVTYSEAGVETWSRSMEYEYDDLKRVSEVSLRDGVGQLLDREWFEYDRVGNFTLTGRKDVAPWTWGASTFSQPAGRTRGSEAEVFTWDGQGRLTERTTSTGTWSYGYDGAGRLLRVSQGGSWVTSNGYDVDDGLVTETHPDGEVYRFGGWREDTRTDTVLFKPVPMLSLSSVGGGALTSRWVFVEPDGHALETATGMGSSAVSASVELLGAYGASLEVVGSPLPIDGYHGADADVSGGVTPFGVRHVLSGAGLWLQPEPLLYLGLTNGDLASPRGYTGVYAAANPVWLVDLTGYSPGPFEGDEIELDEPVMEALHSAVSMAREGDTEAGASLYSNPELGVYNMPGAVTLGVEGAWAPPRGDAKEADLAALADRYGGSPQQWVESGSLHVHHGSDGAARSYGWPSGQDINVVAAATQPYTAIVVSGRASVFGGRRVSAFSTTGDQATGFVARDSNDGLTAALQVRAAIQVGGIWGGRASDDASSTLLRASRVMAWTSERARSAASAP